MREVRLRTEPHRHHAINPQQYSSGSRRQAPVRPVKLFDSFGRLITYLRLFVTDRPDLRCICCMAEHMTFRPKEDLTTLEALDRQCTISSRLGIRKVQLTGSEALVRSRPHLQSVALDDLTLATNGSQLEKHAYELGR